MKSILLLLCLPALSFGQNAETILRERLNEFNQVFLVGNADEISSFIASDYTHTNGHSKAISREAWFNYLRGRQRDIESGKIRVDDYEMTEVEIQMLDQTAIVTGKVSFTVTSDGERSNKSFRVTHVWVIEDEGWKRRAFHDTPINR